MPYTEILNLITKTKTHDSIGNEVFTETQKVVYAKLGYIRSNEFYNAVAVGLTPTAEFITKRCNYENEKELIWNNKRYAVIRTLPVGTLDIAIIVGEKMGVQNPE